MQYFVNQRCGVNWFQSAWNLKRTDFVYRCPSILIVESTKVKWVKTRSSKPHLHWKVYTLFWSFLRKFRLFGHCGKPWTSWKLLYTNHLWGWHHHSLLKKSPIWYVTSCTQKMNTACVNHQTYVINLPSDHIKLHKWGHHSWDWIEIHLFCRTIHMFITFLPCTASDQRAFLGSGQPLKKNRLQTETCTLYWAIQQTWNFFHVWSPLVNWDCKHGNIRKLPAYPWHHQRNSVLH